MGRSFESRNIVTRQIVDGSLVLSERCTIILQTAPGTGRSSRLEARKPKKSVTTLKIVVDTFLQHGSKVVPNLGVGLRLLFSQFLEIAQNSTGGAVLDRGEYWTLLDHFA